MIKCFLGLPCSIIIDFWTGLISESGSEGCHAASILGEMRRSVKLAESGRGNSRMRKTLTISICHSWSLFQEDVLVGLYELGTKVMVQVLRAETSMALYC